ncbi:hypothetical protein ACIQX3_02385 [Peribacillus frigoritolerans]|uniref:hypothetical protein n=1 Tax=Peribacillus frigoritolerans TaxID=450367 RepID=UPI0038306DC7
MQVRRGRTARGKRLPYVPINIYFVQAIKKLKAIPLLSGLSTVCKVYHGTFLLSTKEVSSNVKTKLFGAGVRDSCGNSESKGDPTGASAPRAERPRKASAWSGNQR